MSFSRFKQSTLSSGFPKSKTLWDRDAGVINCEILVVGGGGAGASNNSGGGGAGGLIYIPEYNLYSGQSYSFSIGAGGTGITWTGDTLTQSYQDGGNTTFGPLTALGGGGGSSWYSGEQGRPGGSGGGGGACPTDVAVISPSISMQGLANNGGFANQSFVSGDSGKYGYGFPGGKGAYVPSGDSGGGGGGGAMAKGVDAVYGGSSGTGGVGGIGIQLSITGSATYYASGGGGGGGGGGQGGLSGDPSRGDQGRGGSNSAPFFNGQNATANTGNGGGGGDNSNGGNGGSGIIVIAYKDVYPDLEVINGTTNTVNFTRSTTSRSGYKVYQILAGSGTVSMPRLSKSYSTSGLLFDFDAADLSYTDGQALSSGTSLYHKDNSGLQLVTGGTVTYRTANGGHMDLGSAAGYMRALSTSSNTWQPFNTLTSMSVICWFQSDRTSRQVLVSRFNSTDTTYTTDIYQLNHIVDPSGDYHYNSGGAISGANGNLDTNSWQANTWTLSAWTYNVSDGIARWYENNGTQVTTVNFGTDSGNGLSVSGSATAPFGIGTRSDIMETLKGKIAIVRIYNTALSQSDIQNEYNLYKTRFGLA